MYTGSSVRKCTGETAGFQQQVALVLADRHLKREAMAQVESTSMLCRRSEASYFSAANSQNCVFPEQIQHRSALMDYESRIPMY